MEKEKKSISLSPRGSSIQNRDRNLCLARASWLKMLLNNKVGKRAFCITFASLKLYLHQGRVQ